MRVLAAKKKYQFGEFVVMPFDIIHDAPEPFGYLIQHPECGLVLFVTDTQYLKPTFPGLNQVIIEANYSQEIIDGRMDDGDTIAFVRNRVVQSHMSLDTCKGVLRANDLSKVNNIVLIHLSDGNSHAKEFVNEIQNITGKNVFAAQKDLVIDFDISSF
jgi:phosphoribosyl 1,2-cyclic phosphodiesterase